MGLRALACDLRAFPARSKHLGPVFLDLPEPIQLQRLVEGRGLSEDRARAIIAAQMPIEEKRGRAQHVIDNSGGREETRRQVEAIWPEVSR